MLVLGDAHASDPDNRAALRSAYDAADADVALQLGDIEYYDLPVPTYFIAGNNEDFDVIDALRAGESPPEATNAYLLAGAVASVEGRRVAGLSGNHAPTKFDCSRGELTGGRRRHFTREDVEATAALADVDVLLVHEAPHGLLSYSYDPGCEHVDGLLDALDPDLTLVGHHHEHVEATLRGCRVVSLAPVWVRYYTLDPADLTLSAHDHAP